MLDYGSALPLGLQFGHDDHGITLLNNLISNLVWDMKTIQMFYNWNQLMLCKFNTNKIH